MKAPLSTTNRDPEFLRKWHRIQETHIDLVFLVRRDRSGVVEVEGQILDEELAVCMLESKAFTLFKNPVLGRA